MSRDLRTVIHAATVVVVHGKRDAMRTGWSDRVDCARDRGPGQSGGRTEEESKMGRTTDGQS